MHGLHLSFFLKARFILLEQSEIIYVSVTLHLSDFSYLPNPTPSQKQSVFRLRGHSISDMGQENFPNALFEDRKGLAT